MADVLDAVRDLAPVIGSAADEIDAGRRVPAALTRQLAAAGCFRMAVPQEYGGLRLPWRQLVAVVAELAAADGSVGWVVGQTAQSQGILASFPAATRDAVFGPDPDVRAAGAVAPKGRVAAAGTGTWRASGQWPFVTGCQDAAWLYLNCLLLSGRSVVVGADGRPGTRMVAVPAAEAEVVDSWRVLGLRGTGSHDVRIQAVTVAEEQTFTLDPAEPDSAAALHRIAAAGLTVAACAVGIAEGAVAELAALAGGGKRQSFSPTRMAASAPFQEALGTAWSTARAARALLLAEAEQVDRQGAAGWGPVPAAMRDRAALRATISQVMGLAGEAVLTAYRAGGGAVVYDAMPLQRRLRDAQTAAAHVVAGRGFATAMGALLAGEELPPGSV